jgi:hypothetical protein
MKNDQKNDQFVELIKAEFERRRTRNQAYSLRSFSRDLAVDASNLSKILSYQKSPGSRLKKKLGLRLGLGSEELTDWLEPKSRGVMKDSVFKSHRLEVFEVISGWQHYAILELFRTEKFSAEPRRIAARLGLTLATCKESLERLEKVGLLGRDKRGRLRLVDDVSSSILDVATSRAHRNQQREILESAIDALDRVPIEHRSQSSITMAIDSRKIEQAKILIKAFRRDLATLLTESATLDEVYQLSVSLYPVSGCENSKKMEMI